MNKKKIDAACDLIAQLGGRPEMVRAIVMEIWWEGYEQGRRVENAMILRSFEKPMLEDLQAERRS
jgi:hypothetical protein